MPVKTTINPDNFNLFVYSLYFFKKKYFISVSDFQLAVVTEYFYTLKMLRVKFQFIMYKVRRPNSICCTTIYCLNVRGSGFMTGYEMGGDSTVGTSKSEKLIQPEFWGRLRHANKIPFSVEMSSQSNAHIIMGNIYTHKYPVVYWVDYNTAGHTREIIF
jgi:hypothetical protein